MNEGQSALEYLMTYGWALIVVAVVVGILVLVVGAAGKEVSCVSSTTQIQLKEKVFNIGADAISFALLNATGGSITLASDCVTATDGTYVKEGDTVSVCSPTTVPKGETFTVKNLDGPATAGPVKNGTATITYTTEGGLTGTVTMTCNGTL